MTLRIAVYGVNAPERRIVVDRVRAAPVDRPGRHRPLRQRRGDDGVVGLEEGDDLPSDTLQPGVRLQVGQRVLLARLACTSPT